MELMIVLVITGILAATALPTFDDFIQRGRTAEAVAMLGDIKLRQEAHRAEFGNYLQCKAIDDPDNIVFYPFDGSKMKNRLTFSWKDSTADATVWKCFSDLGANPDGRVRFGYGWAAGAPGTLSTSALTLYELGTEDIDHWFIAQAVTDLDADGYWAVFEMTSFTRLMWRGKGRNRNSSRPADPSQRMWE